MSRRLDLYMEIGEQIRTARVNHGMTQKDLADAVGLTRTSIVHIEAGRQRISIDKLFDVSRVLLLPVATFLPPAAAPEYESVAQLQRICNSQKRAINDLRRVLRRVSRSLKHLHFDVEERVQESLIATRDAGEGA